MPKHTVETLTQELALAQRAGSSSEIGDLALLIQNVQRPAGSPALTGASAAANRQAQRRYQRARSHDQNSARNPTRRRPAVGDWVEDPGGARWKVTQVVGDMLRHEVPGEMIRFAPIAMVQIVDGPAPAAAAAAVPTTPARDERFEACEAFYQGIWDAYEVQDWSALERALRSYEERLAALGV